MRNDTRHLNSDDRIRDLLVHPAFAGFSQLILPWDAGAYPKDMRLSEFASLLPYHSHVDIETLVSALNRMIDDVNEDMPVFYSFYTEAEKQEQPAKRNTGLFFFRGKRDAPFAVISPGGGFSYVASVHEGFPYAAQISAKGYNAFVLRYRVGFGGAIATQDLAASISYLTRNADRLGIGAADYSLWGSSAGARMSAAISSHGVASFGGDNLPRPSAVVIAYTAHSDFSAHEPPTFAVVGERDAIAPPSTMERRVASLRSIGIEVEFHKYKGLGHGFGLGIDTRAEGWLTDAVKFWERFVQNRVSNNALPVQTTCQRRDQDTSSDRQAH